MLAALRHLLAILLLPFVVGALVPWRLLASFPHGDPRLPVWISAPAGIALLTAGLGLFGWCVRLFARVGRGTLAPWDPTRRLVAVGPYRHVRNPMISGVALVLAGEALLWRSPAIGAWLGAFFVLNHAYFLLSEEPGLRKRFGDGYRVYAAHVPR